MNAYRRVLGVAGSVVFLLAVLCVAPASATTVTVNLSSNTWGFCNPITSAGGLTFEAQETGGPFLTAVTGCSGWQGYDPIFGTYVSGLANTPSGNYPTTEYLDTFFPAGTNAVTFWFDNFGCTSSGRGASYFTAFNSSGGVVASGGLCPGTSYNFNAISFTGVGIHELQISNNTPDTFTYGYYGSSWEFGMDRVTYTTGAHIPEPGSMMLLGTGLASLLGFARRRLS